MRENDLELIENKFREFEEKIETLKRLENKLDSLDSKGFEAEVEAIKSKLKRPDKIPEIEKGIVELKERIAVNKFEKKIETLKKLENELDSLDSKGFEAEVEAIKSKLKSPDKIPEIEKGIEELKEKIHEKSVKPIEIEVIHEVAPAPKNAYGVVIGIGKYKDGGIPALKYAKEDAIAIYNILTDPKYGNFSKENVKLLLDEQATQKEIKSGMGEFLARNAGEDDMVCIYFAGHGSPELDPTGKADDNLEKFIVPYDAEKDKLFSSGLSMDVIEEIFHRITSKRVVFFIDSCYSGAAGGRTISRSDIVAKNITISEKFLEQLSGEGRIIITASKPDELSLETEELKHGIFTYYLTEGLKGKADFNKDGVVTVDELYRYVYKQVEEKARQLGGRQHPLQKGTIVGEIPLTRCETERLSIIKELNSTADELFKKGEYSEAIKKWEEVIKIVEKNSEALNGIEKSRKKIEEEFREKQRKLMELHDEGLPSREFDEAMIILKKDPSAYTEAEKKISNNIEELLKGTITIGTYIDRRIDIRKLIEEK